MNHTDILVEHTCHHCTVCASDAWQEACRRACPACERYLDGREGRLYIPALRAQEEQVESWYRLRQTRRPDR